MAFAQHRAPVANQLEPGDRLLLYTTRGCFKNPTRDRGRVVGVAYVATPVEPLPEPVKFGDRSFILGCDLKIEGLAPRGRGVELAPLVPRLKVFPVPRAWSVRLRTALLELPPADAGLLVRLLKPELQDKKAAEGSYAPRPGEQS
jgi:hypothetical protein